MYQESQINNEKIKEAFIADLEELNNKLERQKYEYEEIIKTKENEMMMALHSKIYELNENSKNSEIKLVEELQLLDEKLKIAENTLRNLQNEFSVKEKKFYQEKKEFHKENENLTKKVKELNIFKEKCIELENKIKIIQNENHEDMKRNIEKISNLEQNKVKLQYLIFLVN